MTYRLFLLWLVWFMALSAHVPLGTFSTGPNSWDWKGLPFPWLELHWRETHLVGGEVRPLLAAAQAVLFSPFAALATFWCLRKRTYFVSVTLGCVLLSLVAILPIILIDVPALFLGFVIGAYILSLAVQSLIAWQAWLVIVIFRLLGHRGAFREQIAVGTVGAVLGILISDVLVALPASLFAYAATGILRWGSSEAWLQTFWPIPVFTGTFEIIFVASSLGAYVGWQVAQNLMCPKA